MKLSTWQLPLNVTIGRAVMAARQALEASSNPSAALDAQVLLAYALGVDRAWLFAHAEVLLTPALAEAFAALITRRLNHEPVAYMLRRRDFYGLEFQVDSRVLIPRPETELLVDRVLAHIHVQAIAAPIIADVGTGSGAIAVTLASHCPQATLYAIDLSEAALAVAQANVQRHDQRGQITLLQGDLLAPLPVPVSIIAANLPYISQSTYATLHPTVHNYEPRLALEAGPAGLDAIARLLQQAPAHLLPDGALFLEIGDDQGEAVSVLARQQLPHAHTIALHQDYSGRNRLIIILV